MFWPTYKWFIQSLKMLNKLGIPPRSSNCKYCQRSFFFTGRVNWPARGAAGHCPINYRKKSSRTKPKLSIQKAKIIIGWLSHVAGEVGWNTRRSEFARPAHAHYLPASPDTATRLAFLVAANHPLPGPPRPLPFRHTAPHGARLRPRPSGKGRRRPRPISARPLAPP